MPKWHEIKQTGSRYSENSDVTGSRCSENSDATGSSIWMIMMPSSKYDLVDLDCIYYWEDHCEGEIKFTTLEN